MSFAKRTKPNAAGSYSNSGSGTNSKMTSVKKSNRPCSAPSSASPTSSTSSSSSPSSSRPGSASSLHHQGRPSPSSAAKSSTSADKSVVRQCTKRNGSATQAAVGRVLADTKGPLVGKERDVTERELLSQDGHVTDKKQSNVKTSNSSSSDGAGGGSGRDADRKEVLSGGRVIRRTAGSGGNNEPASVAAAAAECVRAADMALTSGPSQATRSSGGGGARQGRFTAADAAAPRGASSGGGGGPAAISTADPTSCSGRSDRLGPGRRTIGDDDDDDDEDDAACTEQQQLAQDAAGLMCRYDDAVANRHVTGDVSGRCGDVTAMANKPRKSPDPFHHDDVDDADACSVSAADAVEELNEDDDEEEPSSVRRQNSVLTQLLAAKKRELEEARQRFKVTVSGLEDEVDRLRQERERLLDRLQLPEDERCSLSVEQQSLNDLSRRLSQCEQQNAELSAENVELKRDLRDAELAMHELHDQFQADERVELRELQRELDNTARDCRLLHFKVGLDAVVK